MREQDIYRCSFKLRKINSYITIKLHMHKINSYYRITNSVRMFYLQASIFHYYIQLLHKTRITSSSILHYSFTWFFASLSLASPGKWDLDGRNHAARLPHWESLIEFLAFHTLANSNSNNDDRNLLGCYNVLTGKQLPMLWRHCSPPKHRYVYISKQWNTSQKISSVPSNGVLIATGVMCILLQCGPGHID